MDAITSTSVSNNKNFDESTLHSLPKIIIKKENIGLEEYQHQKYQYNLFNNSVKRDQFYDDLVKIRDRLEKTAPNMQQVIDMDMKRVKTNQIYERKLSRELTGPRGLNWQYKQRLQRLESDERKAQQDLMRLNHDLTRISLSSSFSQHPLPHQNNGYSRSQTPRLSLPIDANPTTQTPQKTKLLRGRSQSITPSRTTMDHFASINRKRSSLGKTNSFNEKFPWMFEDINAKAIENHSYLQQHVDSINQQKREIEAKLKLFLH